MLIHPKQQIWAGRWQFANLPNFSNLGFIFKRFGLAGLVWSWQFWHTNTLWFCFLFFFFFIFLSHGVLFFLGTFTVHGTALKKWFVRIILGLELWDLSLGPPKFKYKTWGFLNHSGKWQFDLKSLIRLVYFHCYLLILRLWLWRILDERIGGS